MQLILNFIFYIIYFQVFIVSAAQNKQVELQDVSTTSNTTSQTWRENAVQYPYSSKKITMNSKKISYMRDHKVIDRNINKFNNIIYMGIDYLRELPIHSMLLNKKKLHYLMLISCYITTGILSVAVGFFYSLPISGFVNILEYSDKLKTDNNQINLDYVFKLLEYSDNYYDPSYYKIKPEYLFSLVSMTAIFSVTSYNVISKLANLIKMYKFKEKTIRHSQLIEFLKLALVVVISGVEVDGYKGSINNNIMILYNIASNKLINTKHTNTYNLFLYCTGVSAVIINSAYIMPLLDLLINTSYHGFKSVVKKPIVVNIKAPKILTNFIRYPKVVNIKKRFILELLQNDFDVYSNYTMEKSLQIMNLNLYETINVAGIINHIKDIQPKKGKYNIEDVTHIRGFLEGSFKLLLTVGFSIINFKALYPLLYSYTVFATMLRYSYLVDVNTGYIIRKDGLFMPFNNNKLFLNKYLHYINPNDVNLTDYNFINKINNITLLPKEHVLTIAILISSGVSNIIVDSGYNLYKIIKNKGKLYRGPIPIISASLALASLSVFSYNIIKYLYSGKSTYLASMKILEYQGLDAPNFFGISNPNTIFILNSFVVFLVFMQSYKIFLPITEAITLGTYKIFQKINPFINKD
jgi:hypothetical protein